MLSPGGLDISIPSPHLYFMPPMSLESLATEYAELATAARATRDRYEEVLLDPGAPSTSTPPRPQPGRPKGFATTEPVNCVKPGTPPIPALPAQPPWLATAALPGAGTDLRRR